MIFIMLLSLGHSNLDLIGNIKNSLFEFKLVYTIPNLDKKV